MAVAKQHKGARVTAIDLSPEALAVAARNAAKHGVAERIRFLQGDLFAPLPAGERFDFILSNPPYIAREDIAELPAGVRDYEPHLALDGGPDGYAVFDRLIARGRPLPEAGRLPDRRDRLAAGRRHARRIEATGGYDLGKTIHDYSGHPRVLQARWQG